MGSSPPTGSAGQSLYLHNPPQIRLLRATESPTFFDCLEATPPIGIRLTVTFTFALPVLLR